MVYYPDQYMNKYDRMYLDELDHSTKFNNIKDYFIEREKACRLQKISNCVRLNENQMPEIYNLLPPICKKLGIEVPDLFYEKNNEPNARTVGYDKPFICVTSGMVEKYPSDLISTALAHECGHIACKHSLYLFISYALFNANFKMKIPFVKDNFSNDCYKKIMIWGRCSEISADRAATLCDGGSDNTIELLLRLEGFADINRNEFVKQALDLKSFVEASEKNKLLEEFVTEGDHPSLATRVYECLEWAKSKQFREILDGTYSNKIENKQTYK